MEFVIISRKTALQDYHTHNSNMDDLADICDSTEQIRFDKTIEQHRAELRQDNNSGICLHCGTAIDPERLALIPNAKYCPKHQLESESKTTYHNPAAILTEDFDDEEEEEEEDV